MFERKSEIVKHEGGIYPSMNPYDVFIPVEAWTGFYKRYGHWPGDKGPIDIDILDELTRTRDETDNIDEVHNVRFFGLKWDEHGEPYFETCRTVVMEIIHTAELRSCKKLTKNL